MKKLGITIFVWFSYLSLSFYLWSMGDLHIATLIFSSWTPTEEELARYELVSLIYTSIAVILVIIGGILLYQFMKIIKARNKSIAIPELETK